MTHGPHLKAASLRFWPKVAMTTPEDDYCWTWMGGRSARGYGCFYWDGQQSSAHRAAWVLTYGPIPKGMVVAHRCDNPSCVRPTHLFAGSQLENVQDMDRKGRRRSVSPRGEERTARKLSEAQVVAIRDSHRAGISTVVLGREYGVNPTTVQRIVRREDWAHVR